MADSRQEAIHEAIQRNAADQIDTGVVLTQWVVVAEWMDGTGSRWLSKLHSESTTKWAANGMYHEALYGAWPEEST
jgi:hypothetical protein